MLFGLVLFAFVFMTYDCVSARCYRMMQFDKIVKDWQDRNIEKLKEGK